MAQHRIIAYYMHESEASVCRSLVRNAEETESFMVGDVEEADLQKLRDAGVVIQMVDEPERPPLVDRTTSPRMLSRGFGLGVIAPPAPEIDLSRPNYYRVVLAGPLLEAWRNDLQNAGATIGDFMPGFAMTVRLETPKLPAVRALPFVRAVELLDGSESKPRDFEMASLRESGRTGIRAMIVYDVILRDPAALPEVLQWLAENQVEIAAAGGNKVRIYLVEDSPLEDRIATLPEVDHLEPYVAPNLHNDQARVLLGIDRPNPGVALPFEGDGQIVGVADTGLDDSHPDIPAARRIGVIALGRPGDSSDPHGHGTHVAGSILGDGSASGGSIRGTAPKAKLFFQSLLDAQGKLGGLPFRLQDLFNEAYQKNARIHNNSWGSATASAYRANSNEVDDFVQNNKDMLIVISAGNEGTAAAPRNSQVGFVDWLSIGSPATAKNALTVGASQNNRTSGGFSTLKYGSAWPGDFGAGAPIRDELVSGNPESMAAFSSRGPCDSYRIKPDVVAPGTDVLSCKSQLAPLRNFWGGHSNPSYAYMGGTSMAAPLVSGCAALVREYYDKQRGTPAPSAALIKATIINGTRWLSGAAAIADHPNTPNYHQGFGCVDMSRTVPNANQPSLKLEFVDNWLIPGSQLTVTGQRRRFSFSVSAGTQLRICLSYTDPAGPGLNNNLNLLLQDPNGKKWMGNEQLPMSLHTPDAVNNVEIIRFDNAPAGTYLIQIMASNLLKPAQDFALVVTGDISNFGEI